MFRIKRLGWSRRAVVLFVLLIPTTGCTPALLVPSIAALATGPFTIANAAAFAAGWFFRDTTLSPTTDTQCYRNGESIDCALISP